jgi:hypothetical protein
MVGQRRTKTLLTTNTYASDALLDTNRNTNIVRTDKFGDRLNTTVFHFNSYTDTETITANFEVSPDDSSAQAIWYVSDAFTQNASSSGFTEDVQPTAMARFCRVDVGKGGAVQSQAAPYLGYKISMPLLGFDS